jgi:hypothetical protein
LRDHAKVRISARPSNTFLQRIMVYVYTCICIYTSGTIGDLSSRQVLSHHLSSVPRLLRATAALIGPTILSSKLIMLRHVAGLLIVAVYCRTA